MVLRGGGSHHRGACRRLNAFTPAGSFLHVSNFSINLYGKYLCYAILAISVDLLWGYTGLLSLGQALFFTSRRLHDGDVSHAHDRQPRPVPSSPSRISWSFSAGAICRTFWKPFDSFAVCDD